MNNFLPLFNIGIKRRSKDFFILFYSIVFPIVVIGLLGYLSSKSYSNDFTSYHYYTIVTIPFCSLMALITVSYSAQDEKMSKTSYRYITSPITKTELILSKFFSCATILSLCNVIALLVAKLLFKINFRGNFLPIIILLTAEIFLVTGIGLYVGLACKNLNFIRNLLNLPITILGFLGGAFFPVGSLNPILAGIINLSPITWINRSIVSCVFENKYDTIWILTMIFVCIGALFVYLTIRHFKKEAFI